MTPILPLLEAFLALGLTMIVLTTGVSSLVGVWQRALRTRARGLRNLLCCFTRLAFPAAAGSSESLARFVGEMSLQPTRLAEVAALPETDKDKRYLAFLPDLANSPPGEEQPLAWYETWSSLGFTLDTLSEDEFKTRFKASTAGKAALATLDAAAADEKLKQLHERFVAYGHAETENFARSARTMSIVAAALLAIGANIDAFNLLETYLAQPTLRAVVINNYARLADPATPAHPAEATAAKPEASTLTREATEKIDALKKLALANARNKDEISQIELHAAAATQAAAEADTAFAGSRRVLEESVSAFPVGWDRYPGCSKGNSDRRCEHASAAAEPSQAWYDLITDGIARVKKAFEENHAYAFRWLTGLILTIFMLGLGTPFWIQMVNSLLRLRDMARGGNQAGDGSSAAKPPAQT